MPAPIVLDCDTGEDDALAILLLCLSGEPFPVLVSSYGNAGVESTTRNSAAVLELAGSLETRVIRGSSGPLARHPHRPRGVSAGKFVGGNGLCDVRLPDPRSIRCETPGDRDLPEALWKIVRELAPVRYVATGPLTNLARLAGLAGPPLWDCIESLHVMGGALGVPGNTGPQDPWTGKPYAEFNFYCDPWAVERLLSLGAPIRLVPWDVTRDLTVGYDSLERLQRNAAGPAARFVLDLMEHFFQCYGLAHGRSFELSDPLAAYCALNGGRFPATRVSIVTDGIELGRIVKDPEGAQIGVLEAPARGSDMAGLILGKLGL